MSINIDMAMATIDHIMFRNETNSIDSYVHLLHCAPQYFVEHEQVINLMLDKTVKFLIVMFDTFHKHTTDLKHYVLQHKQSYDEKDYSKVKKMCRIIQQLKSDSCNIKRISQNALKIFQKASDVFKVLNGMKPKGMVGHVQETNLKANLRILLHLLNYKDENIKNANFADILEVPQIYIEQQSKLLEDRRKEAIQDLASYTKKIKLNTNTKLTSINQRSKEVHFTLVNDWVIKEKAFAKSKSEVKQRLSENIHLHTRNLETDLKEKANVWQQNIDICRVRHEKETSEHKIRLEQSKELYEQQYQEVCDKFKRTLEVKTDQHLEEYNCKIELANLQYQNQRSELNSKKRFSNHGQQISKVSELENALMTKKCATDEAKTRKKEADDQAEKQFEAERNYALKEKEYKILKCSNRITLSILNSEQMMSITISKLNTQRKEREKKVWAIYNQKCEVATKIANTLLSNIERKKSAEYKKVNEGIKTTDETVTNESNDSTREAYEIVNKFEEELKKKEEAIIAQTKRLHLQNLFQSMKMQLEYVEHRKQQQMQLSKALSISCHYVDYAIQNIESYLYATDFFWKEIISASSMLLENIVPKKFIELDHLRSINKITEIKKLEIEQKSTTFKISVKKFFVECCAFVNECCLTDEKATIAHENILKLSTQKRM